MGVPWLVHEEGGNENEVVEVADFPDGAKMKERQNGNLTAATARDDNDT